MVRRSVDADAQRSRREGFRQEARDIARRLVALHAQLEAAEARATRVCFELERLFHFIPGLIIFKSPDGVLVRVNAMAAAAFGLSPGDMEGRHQSEFWPPEQCERFSKDDAEIMAAGVGKHGYLEPVLFNGASHTWRTWKVPMFNGRPEPIGIMLFAIDAEETGDLDNPLIGDFRL